LADNQDERESDELSDEPSPHRQEEFRKKGRVAQSKELSAMVALFLTGTAMYMLSTGMGNQLQALMTELFNVDLGSRLDLTNTHVLNQVFQKSFKVFIMLAIPVGLIGFLSGVLTSFSQTGSVFSTEPLNPDISKLDPIKGFKKFLSIKQVYDGFRLIARTVVVVTIAYFLIKTQLLKSQHFMLLSPEVIPSSFGSFGKVVFLSLSAVLLIFAGFDFWLQKWDFSKNLRLTKQEAKQEHREHEGDPLLKARVKTIQRDISRRRMMKAVKTADVIITNPTHIAVAIKYEKDKMMAPKVVAKGADFLAQKIKKVAADSGIPLVENVPLARTLYKVVKVGKSVPKSLYQAVAEVLAYVYRFKNRKWNS